MGDHGRRELLAGAVGGLGGAGVLRYSWRRYASHRRELRLRPVTLVNTNTQRGEVYVRIYAADGYEFHDTLALEAAETDRANAEGSTTTRTLHGQWEEAPREYALTVVSSVSSREGENGRPLTNEDIREEMAEGDSDAAGAAVEIGVFGSTAVHVSASDAC